MKKILSVFIAALILMMSFTAVHCEDDIKVTLDGQEIAFDVPPQIVNERTLVPMRAIFEALGAEVEWSQELQTVLAFKDSKFITMTIGDNRMFTYSGDSTAEITVPDTAMIELDVPPVIIADRTLVPVRAVAESFDCDVDWDGDSRTVIINSSVPEPTAAPAAEPTAAPTAAPSEYTIEYDDSLEMQEGYMKDFTIKNIEKTSDGKYLITYTLRTFLEGRGTVGVTFNCLNADGKVIDTWIGLFIGTDYTWSDQEDTVVISGDTAKIELVLNK